jgi:glycosyltransferase involved in cell wall biosynthesis
MLADYLSTTRGMDRKQFVAVRNWQDESSFVKYHEETGTEEVKHHEVFTFMYLGNVGPLAGIEVLFDAFSQANLPKARLVIAGSGPSKEHLRQLAGRYSCQIEFWDVPTGKVAETQGQADVMMLPMRKGTAKFSVPSKLPAYLFSAKPVIASVDADSDTAHCVKESGAGWLAEPEDISTITQAMCDAFKTSDDNRRKMGECGREYAMHIFTKEKNLSVLSQAIEAILSD